MLCCRWPVRKIICCFSGLSRLDSLEEYYGSSVKPTPKHPHTNRSHGPHTNTNNNYVHLETYTTVVFALGVPPLYTAGALVSWYSGWVLPKWTCWLTAPDKLSAQLFSITTTSLASPACMIDSTLNSYLWGLLSWSLHCLTMLLKSRCSYYSLPWYKTNNFQNHKFCIMTSEILWMKLFDCFNQNCLKGQFNLK